MLNSFFMQKVSNPLSFFFDRKIFDNVSDAVIFFDSQGDVFGANSVCFELFGIKTGEELIKHFSEKDIELINNEGIEIPLDVSHKISHEELHIHIKSSAKKWNTSYSVDHISDAQGCVVYTILFIHENNFISNKEIFSFPENSIEYNLHREIKDIYESIPAGLCIFDLDIRYLKINNWLAKINGFPVKDHIGRSVKDIIPSLHEQVTEITKKVIETCQPVLGIELSGYSASEPDVNRTWKEDWSPVMDKDDKIVGFSVLVEDITERKKAEEALERSLKRFELLSETSGQLLQSNEPQKLIETLCIRVMEHLDCHVFFNYLVKDFNKIHLNAYSGIPEEEAKKIDWLDFGSAVCGCVANSGERIVAEHIPVTEDKRTDLIRSYGIKAYACHPLLSENGQVIGTLSFGTKNRETFSEDDLSLMRSVADMVAIAMDRIQHQYEIKNMALRDEAILSSLKEGLVITGPDGTFQHMNPAALKMHGFDSLNNMWKNIDNYMEMFELYDEKDNKIDFALWPISKVIKGEKVYNFITKLYRKDTREKTIISYNGVRVYDHSGNYINMVFSLHDITELYHRTTEAEEGKKTLEAIMENVPEGITIADKKDFKIKMVSSYGQSLLGGFHNEMPIKNVTEKWKVYYPDKKQLMSDDELPLSRAILKGEVVKDIELIQINNAGKRLHLLCNSAPIKNKDGQITGGIVTWREMSDRLKLEQELRHERELLQTIIDSVPVMFTIWDPKIKVAYINKFFEKITGWTNEDNEKYGIMNLVYPDPEYQKWIRDFMNPLTPGFRDMKMVTKNGGIIESSWANIEISDGRRVGIGIDISERKLFEQQLTELTHRLQYVIENIFDGVIIYDPDENILDMNKIARNMISYISGANEFAVDEIEMYDEQGAKLQLNQWPHKRCLRGNHFSQIECHLVNTISKKEMFVEYSGIPAYEDNKVTMAIITMHDVTEKRKAQVEMSNTLHDLNSKNEALSKINHLHENLLYIISHDLRGPLANMHSIVDVVNLIPDINKKIELIGNLKEMVKKQDNIITGLSEIIEVQSPEKIKSTKIIFEDLLMDILKENEIVLKETNAVVNFNFTEAPEIIYIKSFATSIVKNLISNAIKYRDEKRQPVLNIKGFKKDEFICVIVEDNGIGIDLKNKKNLFVPFKRFSNIGEGKGIGLYIIKNLIEKNGGFLTVESKPGEGTCFYCYFKEYELND